jgi:hypothetical protein
MVAGRVERHDDGDPRQEGDDGRPEPEREEERTNEEIPVSGSADER